MTFYPILKTIWNRERKDKKLLGLDQDFYDKARAYSSHLKTQSEMESDSLLAELFYNRWVRVNFLINDILRMRSDKHIRDTNTSIEMPNLLPIEENEFRSELEKSIRNFKNSSLGIENPVVNQTDIDAEDTYQMIRFVKDDSQIVVGGDLKQYGPFKKGDIAYVPTENAAIYIKKLLAEKF